ncbi:MAG: hypothetical protein H0T45_17240 [Pyrinomonadaceae bacterium]|nr:hypothetical protein [Pyrinomonadaceae bacterium]
MSHSRLIVRVGLCVACLFIVKSAGAQGQEVVAAALPEYMIEVSGDDGCRFAPIKETTQNGVLQRIVTRHPPASPRGEERPSVSTVTVSARSDGELWQVGVSVGFGEFYDAGGQQVATYTLRANERAEVREVLGYGVNAFRVAVVKVLSEAGRAPRISNRTQSLAMDNLEAHTLPEPYRLILSNRSDKDVLAVQLNTFKNYKFLELKWRAGEHLRPLIKAGASYPIEMLSEDRACAGPDGYRPRQSDRIEISAVVFIDGSYEGTPGLAILLKALALGHQQHLSRVMELLDMWSGREDLTPAEITHYFKSLAGEMEETAEPYMLNDLQTSFSELGPEAVPTLGSFLRHGQHAIKTSLLADARALESAVDKGQATTITPDWLTRTTARYKQWLRAAQSVGAR